MMPEMTGMALHEWLAMRHPELAAKVVFLSGGAFTPKAAAYLASVANLRLDKPIDAADLQRLVNGMVLEAKRIVTARSRGDR
jgi:CheY-like chemotaxis protein